MTNETPIYDLKDLSKKLTISIRTLREYVKSGRLKARKVGRAYYITEPNLMAFLDPDT
jgi:excisionase family DNA binding protein